MDPNAYSVSSFTCAWDKAEIVTGKSGSVNITLNPADDVEGVTCSKEVWHSILTVSGTEYDRYIFSSFPIQVQFGATIYSAPSAAIRPIKFPDEPSGNSASFTTVKGRVACSGGGKPTGIRDVDCTALTISKAPTAHVTGTLAFSNGRTVPGVTGNAFFGGDTPAWNEDLVLVDDDGAEYCGDIEYVKSSKSPSTWPQNSPTVTAQAAVDSIYVKATCHDSKQVLQTATAIVVPNPTLTGNCVWTPPGVDIGIGSANLGGVSIERNYGRCTAVVYSRPGYTLPLEVTPEIAAANPGGSIGGFSASSNCGIYSDGDLTKDCSPLLYDNLNVPPELETGDCEYEWTWCSPDGSVERGWPFAAVKKDFTRTSSLQNACVFVKNITTLGVGLWKINGQDYNSTNENATVNLASYPTKDGGYYLWLPPNTGIDSDKKFGVTKGTPECNPGTPRRAVTICKDHCGQSGGVRESIEKDTEYILMRYGAGTCNVRQDPNQTCQYYLDDVLKNVSGSSPNIGTVEVNTPVKIKYTGCTPASVELYCP